MVGILIWSPPHDGGGDDLRKKIRPPPIMGGGVLAKWGVPKNVIFLAVPPPHDGGEQPKKSGFLAENGVLGKLRHFFPHHGGGQNFAPPPHLTAHFFLMFAFHQILPHIFFSVCICQNLTAHFF